MEFYAFFLQNKELRRTFKFLLTPIFPVNEKCYEKSLTLLYFIEGIFMLLEKLINDKLAETNIWFGEKQSTQTEKEAVHTCGC